MPVAGGALEEIIAIGTVGFRAVELARQAFACDPLTLDVKWTETAFERGSRAGTSRWTAILTTVTRPPASADVLRKNPLGIYVDAIAWSRELDTAPTPAPRARAAAVPSASLPLGSPVDPNLGAQPSPIQEANP
jgi:type IV secretion system protein VirB5